LKFRRKVILETLSPVTKNFQREAVRGFLIKVAQNEDQEVIGIGSDVIQEY